MRTYIFLSNNSHKLSTNDELRRGTKEYKSYRSRSWDTSIYAGARGHKCCVWWLLGGGGGCKRAMRRTWMYGVVVGGGDVWLICPFNIASSDECRTGCPFVTVNNWRTGSWQPIAPRTQTSIHGLYIQFNGQKATLPPLLSYVRNWIIDCSVLTGTVHESWPLCLSLYFRTSHKLINVGLSWINQVWIKQYYI